MFYLIDEIVTDHEILNQENFDPDVPIHTTNHRDYF